MGLYYQLSLFPASRSSDTLCGDHMLEMRPMRAQEGVDFGTMSPAV